MVSSGPGVSYLKAGAKPLRGLARLLPGALGPWLLLRLLRFELRLRGLRRGTELRHRPTELALKLLHHLNTKEGARSANRGA